MSSKEIMNYIFDIKKRLGKDLIIPAHHYILPDVVGICDFLGDSYKLAVDVTKSDAKWILFAGVSFMAEGAAILAKEGQIVLSPDSSAGCPMANMIDPELAQQALEFITRLQGESPAPVVYMNSYAAEKAFTGKNGGAVCTSSNAKKIINHYLDQNKSIFFFPDQHLGRNIALDMGISENEIALLKRDMTLVTTEEADLNDIKLFLWDGCCPLHQKFTLADIQEKRKRFPDSHLIVHPEVSNQILKNSDSYGSTQLIYNQVASQTETKKWIIGTELNFISRIAKDFPDRQIIPLKPLLCNTMSQITLKKCAQTLEMLLSHIDKGTPLTRVMTVDPSNRKNAALALQKMIEIVEN